MGGVKFLTERERLLRWIGDAGSAGITTRQLWEKSGGQWDYEYIRRLLEPLKRLRLVEQVGPRGSIKRAWTLRQAA